MTTTLPAYQGLTDAEKMARIGVEVRLITTAKRCGHDVSRYDCTLCGGVITVQLKRTTAGLQKGSLGQCTNPKCLRWDE